MTRNIKCPVKGCSKCLTEYGLGSHITQVHTEYESLVEYGKFLMCNDSWNKWIKDRKHISEYECPKCGPVADTEYGLGSHLVRTHSNNEELYNMGCQLREKDHPYNDPEVAKKAGDKISESLEGREWTEEHKEKHKEAIPSGEDHYRYGTSLSDELREKISNKTTEAMDDEEIREKVSDGAKKLWENSYEEMREKVAKSVRENPPMKGKELSEEHKEKMKGPRPSLQGENNPATREDVKKKIKRIME